MIPKESMRKMAFPIKCFASSGFFRPMERLKLAAPPMPKSRETAVQVMVRGKATLVAAFPCMPTLWPMKNWSTIL